jgi:methionyl-tRNA synthetase
MEALSDIWETVTQANQFIEHKAPWKLAKEGRTEDLASVIATLIDVLGILAKVLEPFIPQTAQAIRTQLGTGGKIAKGAPLFPRIESEKK